MFEPKSRFVLAINIPSFIICFNPLVYFRAGEILARAMFFLLLCMPCGRGFVVQNKKQLRRAKTDGSKMIFATYLTRPTR